MSLVPQSLGELIPAISSKTKMLLYNFKVRKAAVLSSLVKINNIH